MREHVVPKGHTGTEPQERGIHTDPVAADLAKFTHGAIADTYDAKVRKAVSRTDRVNYIRENYFAIQARVIAWAELEPGLEVLDIGIGTALMWEDNHTPVKVSGIDISKRMLKKAANKGVAEVLVQGHFLDIPFPDHAFDRIVSTFAFHHVRPDKKCDALREMVRVLRPGGVIVMGDLMFRDEAQKREVLERMRLEGRQDVIGSIRDEYYTDISAFTVCASRFGLNLEAERGSTLSWVVRLSSRERPWESQPPPLAPTEP